MRDLYGVTKANSATLFYLYTQPDSANNYFQISFQPSILSQSPSDYQAGEVSTCTRTGAAQPDIQCLYSLRVTGDTDWAQVEGSMAESVRQTAQILGRYS